MNLVAIARRMLRLAAAILSVRRKIVFSVDLTQVRGLAAKIPVEYSFGNADDLPRLRIDPTFDQAALAFARERLEAGDRLVLAELGDELVYYSWLMLGRMDLGMRRHYSLGRDTVYSYRVFTAEAQRRRGLFGGYYAYVAETLLPMGYVRAVTWVEVRNRASIHAHDALGLSRIGSIWQFRLLFRVFHFVSSGTRRSMDGKHMHGSRLATARPQA
ncbi:MAG: hypothetical protein ABI759_05885 [Candidatus Solibacter sp.]